MNQNGTHGIGKQFSGTLRSDGRLNSRFRSFARGGSVAVVLVGFLVLAGWIFDIAALKRLFLGELTMKANTAVGFLLAGTSLWLALRDLTDRGIHFLKQACGAVVALIGLLTFSQYLSGWDLGIDQLLFDEPAGAFGTTIPGRMAPNSALNFILLGLGLLLLDRETRDGSYPAQLLIITACVIALLGLLGYAYGVEELYGFLNYTPMAIQTVVAFIVLGLAMLFAHPDAGLMATITSDGNGGLLARRLLSIALIVPAALGWIVLCGEQAGLYDAAFGLSTMAVTGITVLAIVILTIARSTGQISRVSRWKRRWSRQGSCRA